MRSVTDSSSNEDHNVRELKQRALKLALGIPAGHLSVKTPIKMALNLIDHKKHLKDAKEQVKSGALDLNSLSPIEIKRVLNSFNPDWINWLPETLWSEFPCNEITKNKIRAIQTLITTPDTQFDVEAFSHILQSLNGDIPDWTVLYPIPCEEIVYGWLQIKKINPNFELWPEVETYIKACMLESGIVWLPWLNIEYVNTAIFDTPKLKQVWEKIKGTEIKSSDADLDKPLNVQILKLKDIELYLASMP